MNTYQAQDLNNLIRKYPETIVNPDNWDYSNGKAWAIFNEYGLIALSFESNEQDALDDAADAGRLDSCRMSDEDAAEYESKGWDVSYLGNACEPFNLDYISMQQLTVSRVFEIIAE